MDEEHLIVPSRPSERRSIIVDPLDVFNYPAANSYVIPELVDVERFKNALAETLSVFPVYAGRLRCSDGGSTPWTLVLSDGGVPLTVKENTSCTNLFPIDAVVQRPLKFQPSLSTRAILGDNNTSEPLSRIFLTKFPKLSCTAVGIARWHPLGSDFVAVRFARALSQAYQGHPFTDPAPILDSVSNYLPPADLSLLDGLDTTALTSYYNPLSSPHPQLGPNPKSGRPERLDFRLSAKQLEELRSGISALAPANGNKTSAPWLSQQDCVVALVAVCTNLSDSSPNTMPIHTIDTVLDIRGAGNIPTELAGNAFTFAPSDSVSSSGTLEKDIYAFAAGVRHSILRARNPAFLAALTSLHGTKAVEAANRGEIMDLASPQGHMMVNSTLRLDKTLRPGVDFGLRDKPVRSYVGTVPFLRHLKLARPNPVSVPDESVLGGDKEKIVTGDKSNDRSSQSLASDSLSSPNQKWKTRLEDAEVTLFFMPDVKERFVTVLAATMRSIGVNGDIEWIHAIEE